MNFFERQEAVRRRSRRLVVLFSAAVLAIVAVVNLIAWLLFVAFPGQPGNAIAVFSLATAGTLLLMGGASLYRILGLRKGGPAVAASLGGTPVPPDTQDPNLRRLRNVVEEMAIAAGAPMPQVFVLESEPGINAFAAGFSPSDAAVAVTRGALDRLNRAELQAVVAHEMGHVLNGDIRLNLRLVGWLFGIVALGMVGRQVLGSVRTRHRDAAPVLAVAVLLVVLGAIGFWAARLIKAGISRQREYLADASAVQFTRDADGLVGAFLKIAGASAGGRLQVAEAEEVSHMLFEDGIGFSGWRATHPPLLDRIRAIRPGFRQASFDDALARRQLPAPSGLEEDHALGFAPPPLPSDDTRVRIAPAAIAEGIGACAAEDVQRAQAITASIPGVLDRAARDRDEALPLLFGLLFSPKPDVQQRQRFELKARMGESMVGQSADYAERLHGLHAALHLPLAMLALATLKRRARADLEAIADVCFALSHADGRVSLLEYGLAQLLRLELDAALEPANAWRRPDRKLVDLEADIVGLLAAMAHAGHAVPADAQRAFMAGLHHALPRSTARYSPPLQGYAVLDEAWPRLDALRPQGKVQLVEALFAAATHDQQLTVGEAEMLRIVCALLHAPLPAALASVRA